MFLDIRTLPTTRPYLVGVDVKNDDTTEPERGCHVSNKPSSPLLRACLGPVGHLPVRTTDPLRARGLGGLQLHVIGLELRRHLLEHPVHELAEDPRHPDDAA